MAEFLTMEEAEDKFGKKGTARAGLTLGIIGTALAALGNNNGCGVEAMAFLVDYLEEITTVVLCKQLNKLKH